MSDLRSTISYFHYFLFDFLSASIISLLRTTSLMSPLTGSSIWSRALETIKSRALKIIKSLSSALRLVRWVRSIRRVSKWWKVFAATGVFSSFILIISILRKSYYERSRKLRLESIWIYPIKSCKVLLD